jgi:putative hydrolase of the HAD superfamily
MLPQGILFDLDDTIIAFDAVADPTWKRICEEYAGKSTLFDPDSLYNAIHEARTWYWSDKNRHKIGRMNLDRTRREIVRRAFENLDVANRSLAHEIADTYSAQREEAVHFFAGAEDTLKALTARGISLALVTNGDARKQRNKVRRFCLNRFFKTILIEGELGFGKPEEAVYVRALDDLNLDPEMVWSIGDNLEWDVSAPQKLGIFGIWNDFRGEGLPPSSGVIPDRIVNSISELIE